MLGTSLRPNFGRSWHLGADWVSYILVRLSPLISVVVHTFGHPGGFVVDSDEPGQHSTRHSAWAVCSPEADERRGRVEGHDMQNWDSVSQMGSGRFGAASCSGSLDWRLHGFIPSSSNLPIRLTLVDRRAWVVHAFKRYGCVEETRR